MPELLRDPLMVPMPSVHGDGDLFVLRGTAFGVAGLAFEAIGIALLAPSQHPARAAAAT